MTEIYYFLKALLDPVVFMLFLVSAAFLCLLRKNKNRAGKVFLIVSFLAVYGMSVSPVANFACYFVEKDYLLSPPLNSGQLGAVVVLGGGISGNEYTGEMPSQQTAARLLHAVEVFRSAGAKFLICAGKGTGKTSEAEIMGAAAQGAGIPKKSVKLDVRSRNTREHAEELNKIFQDKNIKIGLVTSAYHMKRSEGEFKKYFQNIAPFPSDYLYTSYPISVYTFIPTSTNLHKFSVAFREIIGIVWYKIRG